MSSVAVKFDLTLTTVDCGVCGGTYAINERYRQQKRDEGGSWTCPYCKCSWGYGTSELKRKEQEIARLQQRVEVERAWRERTATERDAVRRQLHATKGVTTKLRKRIANGVCPCCQRTFTNLGRHMHTKHPDYVETSK